jgi:UDPglucose 6-dehydrogenase
VGRIGAVTTIGLAHLGHRVTGIDRSVKRINALSSGSLPEMEPGLRAALRSARRHRDLQFRHTAAAQSQDFVLLCVDTPSGFAGAPDLSQVLAAAVDAATLLRTGSILVTRSTVPVGAGDRIEAALVAAGRPDIDVVHVPEFLREGTAWEDFSSPDRIVVGGNEPGAIDETARLFEQLKAPLFLTDRRTAEMAKYAANAFLATTISFANEIESLSTLLGADATSVFEVLRADKRIGKRAYLTPGLGFGGHCLPKDTAALANAGLMHGSPMALLTAVRAVNAGRIGSAVAWLRQHMNSLSGRTVCLGGLAFKAGTDDLRESPALALAHSLLAEGVRITAWDPVVRDPVAGIDVYSTLEQALAPANAFVVTHAWKGWRDLDPVALAAAGGMRFVYDAPGMLDRRRWTDAGFHLSTSDAPLVPHGVTHA